MKEKQDSLIRISVHDAYQIELRTLYRSPVDPKGGEAFSYSEDIYFFIPRAMGINKDTYPKDLFYRSLTNYIRLKTPTFLDNVERNECRIDLLMPQLAIAVDNGSAPNPGDDNIREVRLFGAYLNDQIKLLGSDPKRENTLKHLDEVVRLIAAYRDMMDRTLPHLEPIQWHPLKNAFTYVDEFLSNRIEEKLADLLLTGIECSHQMKSEFERRDAMNYPQAIFAHTELDKEGFEYRMGRFKKYVSEFLYLEVSRYKREATFTSLAAAGGAIMATIITSLLDPSHKSSLSKNLVRDFMTSIPVVLLVAGIFYATKDLLKDKMKKKTLTVLKPWIPDYNFEIKWKNGALIGRCKENVSFTKTKEVPPEVMKLRNSNREVALPPDGFEEVLHYNRQINFDRNAFKRDESQGDSLKDILRFDFNSFLAKISNAERNERFFDRDFKVLELRMPKVYHIRMIVRYRMTAKSTCQVTTNFEQARLILNKNGIKRIEQVAGSEKASEELLDQMDAAA